LHYTSQTWRGYRHNPAPLRGPVMAELLRYQGCLSLTDRTNCEPPLRVRDYHYGGDFAAYRASWEEGLAILGKRMEVLGV